MWLPAYRVGHYMPPTQTALHTGWDLRNRAIAVDLGWVVGQLPSTFVHLLPTYLPTYRCCLSLRASQLCHHPALCALT